MLVVLDVLNAPKLPDDELDAAEEPDDEEKDPLDC